MTPILISGPAGEPVSLAELKAFLRIDSEAEDALLTALIPAARLTVEAAAGLILMRQTWRLVRDAWPGERVLRLPLKPVLALEAVRIVDAAGDAASLDIAGFTLDAISDPPRLLRPADVAAPGAELNGIEIDLALGFGNSADDVPAALRQAVLRLAAHWFEHRGEEPGAAPPLPGDVVALTAPYRRARL